MIYDLSLTLNADTLPFPDGESPHLGWKHLVDHSFFKCQVSVLTMATHFGTHVDVPLHFIGGGKSTAEVDLGKYSGPAVCMRAVNYREDEEFDITETLEQNSALIKPGDIILLSTGWEKRIGTPEYFKCPNFAPNTGEVLERYGAHGIGFDSPLIDNAGQCLPDPGAAHISVLSRDMSIIESLVNLEPLIGKRFYFSAVPLKFADGDGSPVRAYAVTDDGCPCIN